MDYSKMSFPKPGKTRGPMRAEKFAWGLRYPDGREVCSKTKAGRAEYARRVEDMAVRQNWVCCICHDSTRLMTREDASFEHGDLRGMGGGRRTDAVNAPGNGAAHGWCNGQKGSKR